MYVFSYAAGTNYNNNLDYYVYFSKDELITFSLKNDLWSSRKIFTVPYSYESPSIAYRKENMVSSKMLTNTEQKTQITSQGLLNGNRSLEGDGKLNRQK